MSSASMPGKPPNSRYCRAMCVYTAERRSKSPISFRWILVSLQVSCGYEKANQEVISTFYLKQTQQLLCLVSFCFAEDCEYLSHEIACSRELVYLLQYLQTLTASYMLWLLEF